MSVPAPTRAMVLAAGRGERMRPITDTLPKPLVAVAGRTLLDRALDHLEAAGVEAVIVNSHYLAAQVEAHVAARTTPPLEISHEEILLDTGGGVAKALPRLGPAPFFVVNSDALWTNGTTPALCRLAAAWDGATMDALLLLVPVGAATGYDGRGDYHLGEDGRLHRRGESATAAHVFGGVQILHPRLFDGAEVTPFSLRRLYDAAEDRGRLHGVVHNGAWFHVGTPAALAFVEDHLTANR